MSKSKSRQPPQRSGPAWQRPVQPATSWLRSIGMVALLCACNSHPNPIGDSAADLAIGGGDSVDLATPPPSPDLASPPLDLSSGPDLAGRPPGSSCTSDGECQSGACKPVGAGGGSICVAGCRKQADCSGLPGGLFCEPSAAGSSDGFCIPPSPNHCASCQQDSDCGGLAERCSQAPGDVALACHLDCSLSSAACPSDYDCLTVDEPGGPGPGSSRKLCLPKTKVCLDSLGGYCDRVALPQPCSRSNDAGLCRGQRACLPGGRYDRCAASAPQFKRCGDMDPPGCMLKLADDAATSKRNCGTCGHACGDSEDCCAGSCKPLTTTTDCGSCGRSCATGSGCCAGACTALDSVQNCGSCGNSCPGIGLITDDVFCDPMARTCGLTCRGDNYDVDTNPANGCEVLDITPPGHTQPTAASRGSKSCNDTTSRDTFSAAVPSDGRQHKNPPVDSFSGTVGAAPDWWIVRGDGGFLCIDDYDVTITTSGGSSASCYLLTVITNKRTDSVTVTGASSGNVSHGSGGYSDGSDIYFKIEKSCSSPAPESVSYSVDYHL